MNSTTSNSNLVAAPDGGFGVRWPWFERPRAHHLESIKGFLSDPAEIADLTRAANAEEGYAPDDPDAMPSSYYAGIARRVAWTLEHGIPQFERDMSRTGVPFKRIDGERGGALYAITCASCKEDAREVAIDAWAGGEPLNRYGWLEIGCSHFLGWLDRDSGPGVDWGTEAARSAVADRKVDWLIPDVMERGSLAALVGAPFSGKSLIALEWAVDMARRGIKVLYLDRENGTRVTMDRLAAMGALDPTTLRNLEYVPYPNGVYVDTEDGASKVLDLAKRRNVVVFDSWARFFASGDQSSDGPANRAYNMTLMPLRERGTGILRLDHTGWGGEKRAAGTVVKMADVDHHWHLSSKGSKVTLTHVKNRTNVGPDVLALERLTGPLRHVPRGLDAQDASTPDDAQDGAQGPDDAMVMECLSALTEYGIDPDWSIRRTADALRAARGRGFRQSVVSTAMARRRALSLSSE